MWHLSLVLRDFSYLHKVKQAFLQLGVEGIYHIEEKKTGCVGGCLKKASYHQLEFLSQWGEWELSPFSIDWEKEWQQEEVRVDLSNALSIKLLPGPGFGDATHPTSRLLLELMQERVKGATVIDMGCGSGILSCSALRCGAFVVYSVDLDLKALEHCEGNLFHNGFIAGDFFTSRKLEDPTIFSGALMLINMIEKEQKQVFDSYFRCLNQLQEVFVSGVLEKRKVCYEQDLFFSYFQKGIWEKVEEKQQGIWWAARYQKKSSSQEQES